MKKGGNYGWNLREAKHKFGDNGSDASDKLIDPIFEYHHDVGKSITGGHVYRGSAVPSLNGMYMYADYVSLSIDLFFICRACPRSIHAHLNRASLGKQEKYKKLLKKVKLL